MHCMVQTKMMRQLFQLCCIAQLAVLGLGAFVGESCDSTSDCPVDATCVFSYQGCTTGVCVCNGGFYPYDDNRQCLIGLPFDNDVAGQCVSDAHCRLTIAHSVCVSSEGVNPSQVCRCGIGEVISGDETYCYLQGVAYGQDCTTAAEEEGCETVRMNAETGACVNEVCTCDVHYQWNINNFCEPVNRNEHCEYDAQTDMVCASNLQCLQTDDGTKLCRCPENTEWEDDRCVHQDATLDLAPGSLCNTEYGDAQGLLCAGGLTCGVCPEDPAETAMTCLDSRGGIAMGGVCSQEGENECEVGKAVCLMTYDGCGLGRCMCQQGYVYVGGRCELEAKCVEDDDCSAMDAWHALCTAERTCGCGEGETFYDHNGVNICHAVKAGEACDIIAQDPNDQCLTYRINAAAGICLVDEEVCGCRSQYQLVGEECLPMGYREYCNNTEPVDRACVATTACLHDDADEDIDSLRCICPETENVWHEDYGMCMHYRVDKNLGVGSACNTDYTLDIGRICQSNLECDECPGEEGTFQCRDPLSKDEQPNPEDPNNDSGSSALYSSVLVLATTFILTAL